MKKIILVSIFVFLTLLLVFALFWFGIIRFNYPSKETYPVKGIDISHHQGIIDWKALEKEALDFVYMKATEGGNFVDPKFKLNWKSAGKIKISRGAYHFYRICKNGIEQAENFISVVPRLQNAMPHAIDLEHKGNCKTSKSKKMIRKEISDYITKVKNHYGKAPVIYVTDKFFREYLMNEFSDTKIWIRNIFNRPTLPDYRKWHIWQFTNRGRINGVDTYVDLNVFNGDKSAFVKFVQSH